MLKVVAIWVVMQAQVTLMHMVITGQSIMIGATTVVGILTCGDKCKCWNCPFDHRCNFCRVNIITRSQKEVT